MTIEQELCFAFLLLAQSHVFSPGELPLTFCIPSLSCFVTSFLSRCFLCSCMVQIRVILYTVLSLVPFVLLLPFLGSRELMPLDPSQM